MVPNPASPQNLNRYGYVLNNPIRFSDPSGHICVEGDGTNGEFGMAGNCGGKSNPNYKPGLMGSPSGWTNRNKSTDDSAVVEKSGGGVIKDKDRPTPPCELITSNSTCQTFSRYIGVGVFTLDFLAGIGSTIFAGLMVGAIAGGPFGVGAVAEAYAIANFIEGWMGAASFALTFINDVFITGGSYISIADKEVVLSSDVVISGIFAATGGIDPEPFGDSLINDTAVIYDLYRFNGGDVLFNVHLTARGWYLSEN